MTTPARLAVSPGEAAEMLGVGETTLRRWMTEEALPYARVRGRVLIRVDKLLAWLDAHEERRTAGVEAARVVALVDRARRGVQGP